MNTLVVLQQMIVLFAVMMVGYFCYKKSWLDKNAYGKISKLVVNIMNPMLIIDGVINKDVGNDYGKIMQNLILMVIYYVLLILLSFIVVKILKIERSIKSLYRLMLIFSNVGFIGIPVITSIYGETSVIYIAFYILGYNLLLYTYGLHLVGLSVNEGQTQTKKGSFKKMFNAGVIACIVAIIIFICRITVPAPVEAFISYMGESAIPLSMILIGASMAQQDLKKLLTDVKMYLFLLIRQLVIPIAMALVIRNFPIASEVSGIFILILAMPIGSIVVLLAADQGADETSCTKGSILSTLFSVVTIPIVSLLLS